VEEEDREGNGERGRGSERGVGLAFTVNTRARRGEVGMACTPHGGRFLNWSAMTFTECLTV
jgi:hypothetical protein